MRLLFLSFLVSLTAIALFGPGCANIIPPAGGPRDSLPPVLLKVTPSDSTRNFNGNRISFTFDEFVEVQSAQENLVISPLPRTLPSVEYRLNTVTVKLKDTLEPNTTYFIQFGNAIKDFNEGNVMKGFTYTFSTGNYIDSLEISGKVVLAESGKVDSTLIVMLHTDADDSAVVKQKPRYIAKLDNQGQFRFTNLPPRTFYLYALKDESNTRRYFRDNQLFAFAPAPVVPAVKSSPHTLYAYASRPVTPNITVPGGGNRTRATGATDKRLRYTTSVGGGEQDLQGKFRINFETPLASFDSSKLRLFTDSTFNPVTAYHWTLDTSGKSVTLQVEWKENTLYRLILDKDFAADTAGRKLLKTDTIGFRTRKLSDYGSLLIRFKGLDLSKNPVLLFYNGENFYRSVALNSAEFKESLFAPGEYELRILNDDNKNGKWDPGDFFGKHKQPELVRTLDRRINVKPAFQNEFDLNAE